MDLYDYDKQCWVKINPSTDKRVGMTTEGTALMETADGVRYEYNPQTKQYRNE